MSKDFIISFIKIDSILPDSKLLISTILILLHPTISFINPSFHICPTPFLHHFCPKADLRCTSTTTPPLHHSTTPPLHHSTTPPLHHSTTPFLSYFEFCFQIKRRFSNQLAYDSLFCVQKRRRFSNQSAYDFLNCSISGGVSQ